MTAAARKKQSAPDPDMDRIKALLAELHELREGERLTMAEYDRILDEAVEAVGNKPALLEAFANWRPRA